MKLQLGKNKVFEAKPNTGQISSSKQATLEKVAQKYHCHIQKW